MLAAWDTGLDANGPSIEELPACVESSRKKIVSGEYGSQTTAFRKKKIGLRKKSAGRERGGGSLDLNGTSTLSYFLVLR